MLAGIDPTDWRAEPASWSHLYVNAIFLPRQARDKHRENSKTTTVFSGKTSIGNTDQFGSVTYVLNARELAGRSFWEPVDGGT